MPKTTLFNKQPRDIKRYQERISWIYAYAIQEIQKQRQLEKEKPLTPHP
jgi:hypothetical protein